MKRTAVAGSVLLMALLGGSSLVLAQAPGLEVPLIIPGPGWKTCPRCENPAHIKDDREKVHVDTHPFDAHDISGVWGDDGIELDLKTLPPFTPDGQKMFDETKSTVRGVNSKDPMNICDPLGYPRAFAYNYGVEFMQLHDRVLQFFEFQHTYRTIWTDGRKLPTDPPTYRYLGYSVGHWDGDTFVVESNGFDKRSWLSEDRRVRIHGFPHTADLRVEERYKRLDYGKLQSTLTIIDPAVFTKPWVTTGIATLRPNSELAEYFCVPSEETTFNSKSTLPSTGSAAKTLGH